VCVCACVRVCVHARLCVCKRMAYKIIPRPNFIKLLPY